MEELSQKLIKFEHTTSTFLTYNSRLAFSGWWTPKKFDCNIIFVHAFGSTIPPFALKKLLIVSHSWDCSLFGVRICFEKLKSNAALNQT